MSLNISTASLMGSSIHYDDFRKHNEKSRSTLHQHCPLLNIVDINALKNSYTTIVSTDSSPMLPCLWFLPALTPTQKKVYNKAGEQISGVREHKG